MSLSKMKIDTGSSPSQNYSLPKGIQLGIAVGIPIAMIAAVGVCWWSGVFSSRKPDVKKPHPKDKTLDKLKTSDEVVKPKREDLRPIYTKLKEEGNDCFKKADYVTALELYAKAIEAGPPSSDLAALYQNRAAVFEKLGDWVQVINESAAALKIQPKYIKALSRRSKAYRLTGFLNEALEDITAVCVLESFGVPSSIQTADEILKEIGKLEADRLMKEKKPCAPSNHSVASFLRAFYCDPVTIWWREPSADTLLTNGENTGDGARPSLGGFEAALEALRSQTFDDIIELCTEEIEVTTDSKYKDEAYMLRATFRHLWGYRDEVIEDLRKVTNSKTASDEMKASAWVKMGSQISMQDDSEYENCFKKAIDLYPNCVDIYHQLGQILLTKSDFEGAVELINKANTICPDFPLAAASKWYVEYRIASLTQNEQGVTSAIKNFLKCMRKFDKSPDVFNLYGQILMELGRFQEAIVQFDMVIKLDPNNAAIYVHKAVAQYQMEGNVDKVLGLLRDSLKIDDRNEFVYETIGTLELQAGNLEAAISAITKALEFAKSNQELMMLCSLKKAAEVQTIVKDKYNLEVPTVASYGNPGY